ncbi:alternate-type signal peptide domain-containing protein [Paeniglutamicibacter sp. R2-26]|uniref:alternate-type signal peptide domain-containing protein n=1 Tax=Paeniglutamicibacter sp. R2-26 TaxID=3144417 RepID=UPI003EE50701
MNNKTKGAIAGIAGIALLAGGTTFALWNDSANINGGQITSGNLDVAIVAPEEGTSTWNDVSADRTDNSHAIDLDTFRIVPGDTIQGTFNIDAALEGDNLVAKLGLMAKGTAAGELLATADKKGVAITYSLVDSNGAPVAGATDIALGQEATVAFASADNSNNVAALPTLGKSLDGTADYSVVVTATFDKTTDARTNTQASALLSGLGVTLTQDRTAGTGGGF